MFTSYLWVAEPLVMNVLGPNAHAIQEFMKKYPDAKPSIYDSFLQPSIEIFHKDGVSSLWLVVSFYNVIFIQSESYLRCTTDQSIVHIEHEYNVIDFLQNYDCVTNGHTYPNF